ncbi:MAG: hypothetical protein Kow0037_13330 [Calditrichia bacterium]
MHGKIFVTVLLVLFLGAMAILPAQNLLVNSDLETVEPGFWSAMNDGLGGAQCVWATDDAYKGLRSFKVVKGSATSDAVGWQSVNNADLYWNNAGGNDLYNLSFWAKTDGANTNPANQDAQIGVLFSFYAGGNLIVEKFVPVDQTQASTAWTEYTDGVLVSQEPDEVIAKAVMGKDATGTVWFDNINCNTNSGWTMGIFNGDAETPKGWLQWASTGDVGFVALNEDPDAHSGNYDALLIEKDNLGDEIVFYSEPVPVQPDKWYIFHAWIKTDSVNTGAEYFPTNVVKTRDDNRMGICFFFHRAPLSTAWDLTGGDQFFYIDQREAQSGWTRYAVVAKAPSDAAGASIRARFNPTTTGYAWYDDFGIVELDESPNIIANGDLEDFSPGFWNKLNEGQGGSVMAWADDAAAKGLRSFKVTKSSTSTDPVGWESVNNADLYWNNAGGNDLYNLSFWAKTDGVNTNPANDDAKIGVLFSFYAGGNLIVEKFVPVDQSQASVDWTEYTDGVLVSQEPDEVIARAVMNKDATGTVWFDNINCNTNSGWTMGIFNGDAETPTGWLQWASSTDVGFVALVEDTAAHSGNYSAMLVEKDNLGDEIVFYSEPAPCDPDTWYLISAWIKTDSMNTGNEYYPTNVMKDRIDDRQGICFFYHRAPLETAWDLTGGDQFFYVDQRDSAFGWTKYTVLSRSPMDAAGVSLRARFNPTTTGYAWYDDFSVQKVQAMVVQIEDPETPVTTLSSDYELMQNYPNPFNPETVIEFRVPDNGQVELNIYNIMGQKIRTLVKGYRQAGTYHVLWDGRDDQGNLAATGVYLYQLRGKNAFITKKMMLIK